MGPARRVSSSSGVCISMLDVRTYEFFFAPVSGWVSASKQMAGKGRLDSLDGLRGLAALGVVLLHVWMYSGANLPGNGRVVNLPVNNKSGNHDLGHHDGNHDFRHNDVASRPINRSDRSNNTPTFRRFSGSNARMGGRSMMMGGGGGGMHFGGGGGFGGHHR